MGVEQQGFGVNGRPSPPAVRRCLVVVPTLGRGGTERQAVLVALALRDQGLDVRLFVQSEPDSLARDGVTGTLSLDLPGASSSTPAQLRRLHHAVDSFAPHAVITFLRGATARFAFTRAISAAARRAAWIIAARGNLRLMHVAKDPAVFAAQLLWQRAADRITVNSPALAGNLFAMDDALAGKVVVVPNVVQPFAVDAAEARARVDALVGGAERRPVIGCLGSFQDERNYGLLADALPLVLEARPAAHVLVIGRATGAWVSDVAAAFHARVEALGVRDHVVAPGEVPRGAALLPGLDVFALPSKLEGSSNALAEAMIAGVATATVPVADAEELVAGAAVVSRGWTPAAFAEALLTALDDAPALRERAALRGRALIAERSPERVGRRWALLVEEAVGAARARVQGGSS